MLHLELELVTFWFPIQIFLELSDNYMGIGSRIPSSKLWHTMCNDASISVADHYPIQGCKEHGSHPREQRRTGQGDILADMAWQSITGL